MADYYIGDTIRFKATIKNFDNEGVIPDSIAVSVKKLDGINLYTSTGTISNTTTGIGEYYQDWTVAGTTGTGASLTEATKLIALWDWTNTALPHKKKMNFNVIPTY